MQLGFRAVPIFRYFLVVGGALLGLIIFLGDAKQPSDLDSNKQWTTLDTLRAMAHHGEPSQVQTAARQVDNTPAPIEEVQFFDTETQPAPQRTVTPSKDGFTSSKVSWRNANARANELMLGEHRQQRNRKSSPQTATPRAYFAPSYRTGSIIGDELLNITW